MSNITKIKVGDSTYDIKDDGAVSSASASTANSVAIFDGTSGKTIKSSGYTIGASVPSDAKFTDTTYGAATTSANGLMSSTDKTKLDGIATGATKNTVVNALNSDSATDALSAGQGKWLYNNKQATLKVGMVSKTSGSASGGTSFGSITANQGTFVCWLGCSTSGWVDCVNLENYSSKTTNIWYLTPGAGLKTLGGSLGIACYFLYV